MAQVKITCKCGARFEYSGGDTEGGALANRQTEFLDAHEVCTVAEEEQVHDALQTLEEMRDALIRMANAYEKMSYAK